MREYTVKEIAQIVGGELIAGDGEITVKEFSTNSKEGDEVTMFVPVIGERVDGHDFIGDAFAHGMRATFTCRKDLAFEQGKNGISGMAYVYVDLLGEKNPNVAALQRFGAYMRKEFSLPVVGITGSTGKTSTKEMVASALETKFCTLKTDGNMNSQVGVPRMMLRLTEKHQMAVIEMGMSMPGEMERIARVARPECAVITNISVAHIENLGTIANILTEKLNIINEIPEGGALFVNGDDKMLKKLVEIWRMLTGQEVEKKPEKKRSVLMEDEEDEEEKILLSPAAEKKLSQIRIFTFGTEKDCDYRAKRVQTIENGTQFTLCGKEIEKELVIKLSVVGQHHVENALAAFAVAMHFGITPETVAEKLFDYQPPAMRGGKIEAGGVILIDDTYNANPDSVHAALTSLAAIKAKRRIAVLGDMLELGEISRICHGFIGENLLQFELDYIVGVGNDAECYVTGALRAQRQQTRLVRKDNGSVVRLSGGWSKPVPTIDGKFFLDNASALAFLKGFVQEGDAVLFKGSRAMKMEEIAAGLREVLEKKGKN